MINSKFFEKYFRYSSASDMYKALNERTGLEENKAQGNTIGSRLVVLQMMQKLIETEKTCWNS